MNKQWAVFGAVWVLAGCGKSDPPRVNTGSSASASSASITNSAQTSALVPSVTPAPVVAPAPSVAPAADSATPPSSFAGAQKENLENAVGLGCEARSASGFLELLCRKKNGTGGHPVQAELGAGEDAADNTVLADEHGELRVVVPYREGAQQDVPIVFSDTKYTLRVSGASAKLEWAAAGLPLRRACQKIADESHAVLKDAQGASNGELRVLAADLAKFPRFGVCQQAGLGSWALALKALRGSGEGASRTLHADIDVVRVSDEGALTSATFGSFHFAPGGFEIGNLQAYDYDDDGRDELIVPYELTAVPPGQTPARAPSIWTWSESGVSAFTKAPESHAGGASIEQLEFDMRPDIGDYGPYVAWLSSGCGARTCPSRLTGPKFYARSLPDGSFTLDDPAAKSALKRACPKKPEAVVVPLNLTQTAKNLVCARVLGVSAETVLAEIADKRVAVCSDQEACAARDVLEQWAKLAPPITLEGDKVAVKP